jgi:hypothetical protein
MKGLTTTRHTPQHNSCLAWLGHARDTYPISGLFQMTKGKVPLVDWSTVDIQDSNTVCLSPTGIESSIAK